MDDRKLHTLLTVASAGSLNAAAEQLHCSQSAVTQIMNAIEKELGFTVFRRTNRGVILTAEGSTIMPYVTTASQALSELQEAAETIAAGKKTPLRVGTYSSISIALMPGIISAFHKQFPGASFEIVVGADELPSLLENGKIHVLLIDEARKAGASWFPVLEDHIYAVAPASFRLGERQSITLEKLKEYPVIINPLDLFPQGTQQLKDAPDVTSVMTADSLPQLRMAARELGIALLPELSLRAETIPENIDLLELDPPVSRTIGICLPDKPLPIAKKFAAFLRENAETLLTL